MKWVATQGVLCSICRLAYGKVVSRIVDIVGIVQCELQIKGGVWYVDGNDCVR